MLRSDETLSQRERITGQQRAPLKPAQTGTGVGGTASKHGCHRQASLNRQIGGTLRHARVRAGRRPNQPYRHAFACHESSSSVCPNGAFCITAPSASSKKSSLKAPNSATRRRLFPEGPEQNSKQPRAEPQLKSRRTRCVAHQQVRHRETRLVHGTSARHSQALRSPAPRILDRHARRDGLHPQLAVRGTGRDGHSWRRRSLSRSRFPQAARSVSQRSARSEPDRPPPWQTGGSRSSENVRSGVRPSRCQPLGIATEATRACLPPIEIVPSGVDRLGDSSRGKWSRGSSPPRNT